MGRGRPYLNPYACCLLLLSVLRRIFSNLLDRFTLQHNINRMKQVAVILSALAAVALCQLGPGVPANGATGFDCQTGHELFADSQSLCWYWQCVAEDTPFVYRLTPKACAGGTLMSPYFVSGEHNPCTVNLNSQYGYECARPPGTPVEKIPDCVSADAGKCQNGGTLTYEADTCWCLCPPDWQGDYDCSKRTGDPNAIVRGGNICKNGVPLRDWCAISGGFQNSGICYNQCDDFWCECPNREIFDQYGKRCERKP